MKNIDETIKDAFNLHKNGEIKKAIRLYSKVLLSKKDPNLLFLIGTAHFQIKDFEKAILFLKECVSIDEKNIGALNNLGGALQNLKKFDEAIMIYEQIILNKPDFAEAYNNIGNCYLLLNNNEKAIENYEKSTKLKSDNFVAYLNLGNVYRELKKFEKAIVNYEKSIELNSNYFMAYNNLGNTYKDLGELDKAVLNYEKSIKINKLYDVGYENLGNIYFEMGKFEEASNKLNEAYRINNNRNFLLGKLIHNKMHICDWKEFNKNMNELMSKLKKKEKVVTPFELINITDDPELILLASKIYVNEKLVQNKKTKEKFHKSVKKKYKIAYFSPDFRNHPVIHLIKDLFKYHDKSKFEIYAFSFEPEKNDEIKKNIKKLFKEFIEVKDKSDEDIIKKSKELEIDIAIDLCGFTAFNRIKLFSKRVAPIQINYLGYPGTMGSTFFDYIIGDKILIEENDKKYYSEKVLNLKNCYQPNSSYVKFEKNLINKKDFGLPENKIIFCNFGSSFKIRPDIFRIWMKILEEVPNSILWLLKSNNKAVENLKKEATNCNINEERLIFAEKISHDDHLERITLADIFLDTFPYTSHTTASDFIRMGVPIITLKGESFASRVCSSILNYVGMQTLSTNSLKKYEEKAIQLGNNNKKLEQIKKEIKNNCLNSPLFKIEDYTKDMEKKFVNLIEKKELSNV